MRTIALALTLFAGALVREFDFGHFFAAEAKTSEAKRLTAQQHKQRKHANKTNPKLPPNLGPGVGTGL